MGASMLPVILIAAVADNGVIGRGGGLAFRQRSDLRRFKALTLGKPIVMGRLTWQSIGAPLPGRETIVVTRERTLAGAAADRVHLAASVEEAMKVARTRASAMGADAVAIVGGARIYAATIEGVDRLLITEVHARPEGDTVFPTFDRSRFREVSREAHLAGEGDEYPFSFVDHERR